MDGWQAIEDKNQEKDPEELTVEGGRIQDDQAPG